MQKIKVELVTSDGEDATVLAIVEGPRPGQLDVFGREKVVDLVANRGPVEITLIRGQRLVIGEDAETMVYDPWQNASVRPSTQFPKNEDVHAADSGLNQSTEAQDQRKLDNERLKNSELRVKMQQDAGLMEKGVGVEANKKDDTTKANSDNKPAAGFAGVQSTKPIVGIRSSKEVK